MLFKKKDFLVVISSSLVIAVVLVSTLIGYSLYLQWKKDTLALDYRNSIYRLTAEIFKDDILVSNVHARIGDEGPLKGVPLLEGTMQNNSDKTVDFMVAETSFSKADGSVVYKNRFYPLGKGRPGHRPIFHETEHSDSLLLPGGTVSFRHLLRNCPREIMQYLSRKGDFAKSDTKDRIILDCSIERISLR